MQLLSNELVFLRTRRFVDRLASGSIFDSLQALTSVAPAAMEFAPDLFAFVRHHRDAGFLAGAGTRTVGAVDSPVRRAACLVDATVQADVGVCLADLDGLPGVDAASRTAVTFGGAAGSIPGRVEHFRPVGYLALPGGDGLTLAFPPVLDLVDFLDRERFATVAIGAPGLAGLAVLAAARHAHARTIGIFRADVFGITGSATDESLDDAAWPYVRWFYEQMDEVFVTSETSARRLVLKGFDRRRLTVLADVAAA